MLANTFSHGLIRDYVVAFGTLFNNIKINRRAASGESASTIAVPLSYAPRHRYLERIEQDLNLDKPVSLTLPRMSFELMSTNYSSERKLNTMQTYVGHKVTSNTQLLATYAPVPYDFTFQINIYISNIEDGTHIVEQILPYFTPEFTVSLKSATEMGLNLDLPIVLNSVNMEDSYEGGFDDRRIIIWTIDFTLKGNLFGPMRSSGLVNKVTIGLHPSMDTTATTANSEQIITQAAMFANGSPTTEEYLSVDPNLISVNSDYGISQEIYSIGEDPNVYKFWNFDSALYEGLVEWGDSVGNTTFDGWQTLSTYTGGFDSTVELSRGPEGTLRHTTTAQSPDQGENVKLLIYANNAPFFDAFYGKRYQNMSIRYRTRQTAGADAENSPKFHLRWLTTTDSDHFTTTVQDGGPRYNAAPAPSTFNGSYGETWHTAEWDLSGHIDWNDRIITALLLVPIAVGDVDGQGTFVTDIDYIKIFANTTA